MDGTGRGGGGRGRGERKSECSTADTAWGKTVETVDRRQNNGSVKAVSPRHCPAASALPVSVSTAVVGRVRCTAVEEQPEAKEVQLSRQLLVSLLGRGSSSTSLRLISPGTL